MSDYEKNNVTERASHRSPKETKSLALEALRIFGRRNGRFPSLSELLPVINTELLEPENGFRSQSTLNNALVHSDSNSKKGGRFGLSRIAMQDGIFEAIIIDGELFSSSIEQVAQSNGTDISQIPTEKLIRSMADIADELVSRNIQ